MRGIRFKISDYQKLVLTSLLTKGIQDKGNPTIGSACQSMLDQIEEKTKAKFYDKKKRKVKATFGKMPKLR